MRAAVHVFLQECRPQPGSAIYLSEQTTALYRWFRQTFPRVTGSEHLGDAVARGSADAAGIRNEDLTRLSFDDEAFDHVLSFDVLEHIPDYRTALAECCRCLRPGGTLLLSVPFVATAEKNVVRARMSSTGDVTHVLPPEYHGDPLSAAGCLCFVHFGWELLDDLAAAGFVECRALLYWSREYCYLGGEQVLLVATKPARRLR
jgi:SAM-dependent methyltransferase